MDGPSNIGAVRENGGVVYSRAQNGLTVAGTAISRIEQDRCQPLGASETFVREMHNSTDRRAV